MEFIETPDGARLWPALGTVGGDLRPDADIEPDRLQNYLRLEPTSVVAEPCGRWLAP